MVWCAPYYHESMCTRYISWCTTILTKIVEWDSEIIINFDFKMDFPLILDLTTLCIFICCIYPWKGTIYSCNSTVLECECSQSAQQAQTKSMKTIECAHPPHHHSGFVATLDCLHDFTIYVITLLALCLLGTLCVMNQFLF